MVMPASCDGAATRVTVLSYQSLRVTRVEKKRMQVTCDTRALG